MKHLTKLLEAAFFAADRPLTVGELKALEPGSRKTEVQEAIQDLSLYYAEADRGIEVVELADGFQVLTRPEFAEAIARARVASRPRRLSPAALETLSIIAYRQPVGRSEIEDIRGVAADGVLRMLQERGLVDVAGRSEGLGRPLLYGTTDRFLEMLGLKELTELPRLEELAVSLRPTMDTFQTRAAGQALDEMLREGDIPPPSGDQEDIPDDAGEEEVVEVDEASASLESGPAESADHHGAVIDEAETDDDGSATDAPEDADEDELDADAVVKEV